jgi:RsiW-degrading membrane proteinase PrsW (M82 family)
VGGFVIFAFAFSTLVALFWLRRFRRMDKYEKEPERLIYVTFGAGALAIVPSAILESFVDVSNLSGSPLLPHLFLVFLWVGIVEEFFKYLAVRLTVYRSNQFNEVMDGMIYMISAALGFAAAENVGYILGFGFFVGVLRAILSYLGHVSFSAVLGYYLGKAKIEGKGNLLWVGFIWAICLHWLYDAFFVIGTVDSSLGFLFLGLMAWVFGLILTYLLSRKAQAVSPFRTVHLLPKRLTRSCHACGKTVSAKAWICHHCGEPLKLEEEEITLKA